MRMPRSMLWKISRILSPTVSIDALDVQFGGQGRLHAVDDGQLGGALLLGFEQALGLIETGARSRRR